jgi:serine/threonine protein kinase
MSSIPRYCNNCGAINPIENQTCFACQQELPPPEEEAQRPTLIRERYRLIKRIGVGGFSSVERAEDLHSGRVVAIKCISLQGLTSQEIIDATDTFNREFSVLSGLSFPHLPHIYDSFSDAEHWYLVMDWIDGETLDEYYERSSATSSQAGLPFEEVLDIGLQLCKVLDYLHTRNPPIIFRDLKPSNIMRTRTGDLYLIDFGIARRFVPGKRKDTIPLGSPGYAAPEQYGIAQTTPQSDLYSFGVLLYYLLTGNDPIEKAVAFPLSGASTDASKRDLEVLIMQLAEPNVEKRPESIPVVEEELERIVRAHLPITSEVRRRVKGLASPSGSKEAIARQQPMQANAPRPRHTRRKVLVGLGVVTVLATTGVLRAAQPLPSPGALLALFEPTATANRSISAQPEMPGPTPTPETTPTPEVLPHDKRMRFTYQGGDLSANSYLIWSSDSKRYSFLQDADGASTVYVRDVATEKMLHHYDWNNSNDALMDIAWSPDGNFIAIGFAKSLQIWKASQDNRAVVTKEASGSIFAVAWSPDGKYIAAATINDAAPGASNSTIYLWDAITYQVIMSYTGHQDHVYSVSWSPDSKRIVSSDRSGVVKVWESNSGKDVLTYQGHQPSMSVSTVRWSPDGTSIASGGDDTTVQVWNAVTGKTLYVYRGHTDVIADLSWSPSSKQIVSSGAHNDSSVQIWEATTGKPFAPPYHGHSSVVISVAWSPNGLYIASACDADHTVQIWTPR